MTTENLNLDQISAKIGFDLADKNKSKAKEFERVVTKALGILIEDGLLAYAIWLESEDERDVIDYSFTLLKNKIKLIKKDYGNNTEKLRKAILDEITPHIQKTLLARQLLERMLVYARYRAKATQKGD
jgi:hypothetical protein